MSAPAEAWEHDGVWVAAPKLFGRVAVVVMVEDQHLLAELVRMGAAALAAQRQHGDVAMMTRGRSLACARAFIEEIEGLEDDTGD